MKTADVVIIGGGIVGVSTAYALGRLGVRNVVLIERDRLGEASTARCASGIRGLFATDVNIRMSVEALRFYASFKEEIGADIGYHRIGYQVLLPTPADVETARPIVARQVELGVPSRLLSPAEVKDLNPLMYTDDLAGAIYSPEGGWASPHEVVMGLATRTREMAIELRQGAPCTGLRMEGNRVVAVETATETIAAGVVVLSAGVWSREIAGWAGVDLPVFATRSSAFMLRPRGGMTQSFAPSHDLGNNLFFRPDVGQILAIASNPDEPVSFRTDPDWETFYQAMPMILHRLPALADAEVGTAWAGSSDPTPDRHAIMGPMPELEGILIAAGFSGHGFMHGPIGGKIVAEWIVHGEPRTVDVSHYDVRRFDPVPPPGLEPIYEKLTNRRSADVTGYRRKPGLAPARS